MRFATVHRRVHRAAALLVACVFLTLPTLARLHDHLSAIDTDGGFRLSKNIERPHERQAAAIAIAVAVGPRQSGPDLSVAGATVIVAACWPTAPTLVAVSDRAPPAR